MSRLRTTATRPRDFTEAATAPPLCQHAKALQAWYDEHIDQVLGQSAALGKLREARLQLADNFMQRHQAVPPEHVRTVACSGGHRCLLDGFEHLYWKLYARELDHAPRPLGPPPPRTKPPTSREEIYSGLLLGDELADDLT